LSEYQKQRIGSRLTEYAINEVKAQGFAGIIVLGHEHFYPRFGFVPARNFRIRPSFPLKNENCFMALELKPQALHLEDQEGVVQYLPEFGI
jgi:predicted N-acetyltransferase YhbS